VTDATIHQLLQQQGLTTGDLAWFESLNWDDAAVPPADPANEADYRRREAALNRALESLSFSEKGESREGKMAAALGAKLADLRDPEEDEDE
jgi:hypothetical protein